MDTQRALEWISGIFAVKHRVVEVDDTRDSLAEWDSLGSLLLLSALEEEHKIVISADDLEAMTTIREICDLLEKHGAFRTSEADAESTPAAPAERTSV
jgi:acyl carrier protein